ncbi:MAG: Na/Pi cotransporter family protein, partial [Deltaproteobacteria bacterium]|nr:Na/Pi cotransporter family protein [Deltaproteobacteria bacterium]
FIGRHIANTHTLFNILNTIVFLPLVGMLAKISTLLIRGEDVVGEFHLKFLDTRVLNTPPVALGQARSETVRMARLAMTFLEETNRFLDHPDEQKIKELQKNEDYIDLLQKEITNFLVQLSQQSISSEVSREIASLMHMVNDLERVGDHCENLWELRQRAKDQKIAFSDTAKVEIAELCQLTQDFLAFVIKGLETRDKTIGLKSQQMENSIDRLEESLRNNHITRLNTGECNVLSGLIYIDMLHNFEKIGDHTFNLSEAVIGIK